jgi:hypothetical protein
VFAGAEMGGAASGDCAEPTGAANSVMAIERAEMRGKGMELRVMVAPAA